MSSRGRIKIALRASLLLALSCSNASETAYQCQAGVGSCDAKEDVLSLHDDMLEASALALLQKNAVAVQKKSLAVDALSENRTVHEPNVESSVPNGAGVPEAFTIILCVISAVAIVVLALYEYLIHAGCISKGDPHRRVARYGPELQSYWINNFASACIVTAPLATSYDLSVAMNIGAAMSGLLVTGGAVVQVVGIQWSKSLMKPWDQSWIVKFGVLSRIAIVAVIFIWVFGLLCPFFVERPGLLCAGLLTSRLVSSFLVGLATSPIAMIAIRAAAPEDMTMLQSTGTAAGNFGACFGLAMSSASYLLAKGANANIYVMSAIPMALVMVLLLLQGAHMAFSVSRYDTGLKVQPRVASSSASSSSAPRQAAMDVRPELTQEEYHQRAGIVFWALVFSCVQNFVVMAVETGSSMMLQVEYKLSVSTVGYLTASYCLGAVFVQVFIVYVIQYGWNQNLIMITCAWLCIPFSVFVFNFGPWWQLYLAELGIFNMVTLINGVASGIACNAAIPDTFWSLENFTANGKILTCSARFVAGPFSRMFDAHFGRNGYNAFMQAPMVLVGVIATYQIWVSNFSAAATKKNMEALKSKQ